MAFVPVEQTTQLISLASLVPLEHNHQDTYNRVIINRFSMNYKTTFYIADSITSFKEEFKIKLTKIYFINL